MITRFFFTVIKFMWGGKMEKRDKIMSAFLVMILFMLIFEFGYTIVNFIDYEARKDSGNERWKQVEERIKKIEECCGCGRDS